MAIKSCHCMWVGKPHETPDMCDICCIEKSNYHLESNLVSCGGCYDKAKNLRAGEAEKYLGMRGLGVIF